MLCVIKQREEESREEDETEGVNTRGKQLSSETNPAVFCVRASVAEESRLTPDLNYQGRLCWWGKLHTSNLACSVARQRFDLRNLRDPLRALLPQWFFSPVLRKMDENGSGREAGSVTHRTTDGWKQMLLLQYTPLTFFGHDQSLCVVRLFIAPLSALYSTS